MYYTKLYYKNYTQTYSGLEEYRLYLLKRRDNKFFQFLFGGIKINLIEKWNIFKPANWVIDELSKRVISGI